MAMFPTGTTTVNSNDLYNGNIGKMVTTITNPTTRDVLPLANQYQYDQLNRLLESNSYQAINAGSNAWQSAGTAQYYNRFTYDANGNILEQFRKNESGTMIDSLSYNYHRNDNGKLIRNRLPCK